MISGTAIPIWPATPHPEPVAPSAAPSDPTKPIFVHSSFDFLAACFDAEGRWCDQELSGLDIETEGVLSPWDGEIATVQIDLQDACHVVHWDRDKTLATVPGVEWLKKYLLASDVTKAIHNAAFEQAHFMRAFGMDFRLVAIHDTRIAEYNLAEGNPTPEDRQYRFSLGHCVRKRYGVEMDKDPALRTGFLRGTTLTDRERDYAAFDTIWATRLARDQQEEMAKLTSSGVKILTIFAGDLAQVPAIARMGLRGIPVDVTRLRELDAKYREESARLTMTIETALWLPEDDMPTGKTGRGRPRPLNLDSGPQMVKRLNRLYGLTLTDFKAEELKHHRQIPVVAEILRRKRLDKLTSTYTTALQEAVNPLTGCIHGEYDPAHAATGRAAMKTPNLQNLPKRTFEGAAIRTAFRANPGKVFVFADFPNIELRLIAEIFEDRNMLGAFQQGLDLHAFTAAMIMFDVQNPTWDTMLPYYERFMKLYQEGDPKAKKMRQDSKMLNFSFGYGAGATKGQSIAWREYDLWFELAEMEQRRGQWLKLYNGVKRYHDRRKAALREGGGPFVVQSADGRRRIFMDRQTCYSESLNHPIQSTSAEMTKRCHVELDRLGVPIVLVVHDEFIAHVPARRAEATGKLMCEVMERIAKEYLPRIPCPVEFKVRERWEA